MNICVFCSSSDALGEEYFECARGLGRLIALGGHSLVFGAGDMGLMGALARAAKEHGGHVTGVIPKYLDRDGIAFKEGDDIVVAEDLRERKAEMERRSDAFVALPGGFGTIEEVMEQLTQKQLGVHTKPVILIDTLRFYSRFTEFFTHLVDERFLKKEHCDLYRLVSDPDDVLPALENGSPAAIPGKYFDAEGVQR